MDIEKVWSLICIYYLQNHQKQKHQEICTNKVSKKCICIIRVADPVGFYPDPGLTLKKTGSGFEIR